MNFCQIIWIVQIIFFTIPNFEFTILISIFRIIWTIRIFLIHDSQLNFSLHYFPLSLIYYAKYSNYSNNSNNFTIPHFNYTIRFKLFDFFFTIPYLKFPIILILIFRMSWIIRIFLIHYVKYSNYSNNSNNFTISHFKYTILIWTIRIIWIILIIRSIWIF